MPSDQGCICRLARRTSTCVVQRMRSEVINERLRLTPENPHAHLGLCRSYLLRRENQRAAEAALRSIGLLYQHPMAHYRLAVALHRMGRILPAVEALQVAISLNPNFPEAHQRLVALYRNRLGDPDKAAEHRKLAAEMRLARRQAVAASQRYQSSRVGGQLRITGKTTRTCRRYPSRPQRARKLSRHPILISTLRWSVVYLVAELHWLCRCSLLVG